MGYAINIATREIEHYTRLAGLSDASGAPIYADVAVDIRNINIALYDAPHYQDGRFATHVERVERVLAEMRTAIGSDEVPGGWYLNLKNSANHPLMTLRGETRTAEALLQLPAATQPFERLLGDAQ